MSDNADSSAPNTPNAYLGAKPKKFRVKDFYEAKASGQKITMLTAYDALIAGIFDRAGIQTLLVGDSVGNVNYNYPTTLPVSLEQMEWATRAVCAGVKNAFVIADMPFGSYESDDKVAVESAVRLLKCGANAVKLEGGARMSAQVRAITHAGIPVVGHLGYTPQSDNLLSGPRMQGRGEDAAKLLADAQALVEAGAIALVLEMVPADLSAQITAHIPIATIGIGSGPDCDGQVLVWSDMAGMSDWVPSFVHRFGNLGQDLTKIAQDYASAVTNGTFPGTENYKRS